MQERKKIIVYNEAKLIIISSFISLFCCVLAYSLKLITEYAQHHFREIASSNITWFLLFPTIGITIIYFFRKHLFHNRKNKGIAEIYKTLDLRKDHLPLFKVPFHYINGFFTVIFGGSTGIEVSTVVATATLGNEAYKVDFSAKMYKRELISAAVVAGVAVLFQSPIAGFLFAVEAIARKFNKYLVLSCGASALVAWGFISIFKSESIFPFHVQTWSWQALPFFVMLSLFGSLLSIYFTLLVIKIKEFSLKIRGPYLRLLIGTILIGISLYCFPFLYGDSYHGTNGLLQKIADNSTVSISLLTILVFSKPLVAALTLGAGGDGGVFAPSIVAGAVLGILFAQLSNHYFGTSLIPVNFALAGAAATLSPSISAPFTTFILVCNLVPNGFVLFFPILLSSFIGQKFARFLLPYNVYSYTGRANGKPQD